MNYDGDVAALDALTRDVMRLLMPKPRRTPVQWAEAERRFGGATPEPGRYRASRLPYEVEPTEAAIDPTVLDTTLVMARQTGKTTCTENVVGYHIDEDPTSILVVYPALEGAKNYMRRRFMPMVRLSPSLRTKVRETKFKSSDNTILHKGFPGGYIVACGSGSASALRQQSFRVVVADEVDEYQDNEDGDPLSLAIGRADAYHNAVVYILSTPTYKSTSRIWARFLLTDQRYWFVPCPKCQHHQILKWANLRWTWTEPDGSEKSDPSQAYYECGNLQCKHHWSDAERIQAIMRGQWRATAPFNGHRGYHLSGLYRCVGKKRAYASYLHQFAAEFLTAKHESKESLRQWTNQFLAECWEDEVETVEASPLMIRRENYEQLPVDVLALIAGVDIQQDRWEGEVVGYGEGEISWGVEYVVHPGSPQQEAYWKGLAAFLRRVYKRQDGLDMGIACAGIDSGYAQETVLPFCAERAHERVFAVKGASEPNLPILASISRNNTRHLPQYFVGTDTAKALLYHRLKLADPKEPGFCHFRGDKDGYNSVYFEMLTSHEFSLRMSQGKPKRSWQKKRMHDRDEALDCRVYGMAALVLLNPDWAALRANLLSKVELLRQPKEGAAPSASVPPSTRRVGNMLGVGI